MPLVSIHPNAMPSALAAEAAAVQGRFWEMSDLLFENQQAWSPMGNANEAFMVYAGALGLDTAQFERDMRSEAVRDSVIADVALSNQLRLAGTPSFFLNDQPIPLPSSYADFERTIYDAIQSAE
jgi:protein-disulfide isomerase